MKHSDLWMTRNWVCWTCQVQCGQLKIPIPINNGRICFSCNNPMTSVGIKFKTPKKSNKAKWKLLQRTWEHQYTYSSGNSEYVGPIYRVVLHRC